MSTFVGYKPPEEKPAAKKQAGKAKKPAPRKPAEVAPEVEETEAVDDGEDCEEA